MQGHLKTLNSRFFPTKRNEPKIQKRTLQRGETHDDLRTYNPAKVKHADFRVVRGKHLSRCMMGQAGPCIRIAYKDCKKKQATQILLHATPSAIFVLKCALRISNQKQSKTSSRLTTPFHGKQGQPWKFKRDESLAPKELGKTGT